MPYVLNPVEPAGNFAGIRDADMGGGYRVVADQAARDAIPTEQRVAGMVVHVQSDASAWRLNPDLNIWTLIQSDTSVTSVFGRTGDVIAQQGDYTFEQITGALDAQQIADGSVTNSEFQHLAGAADNIQTQINGKALAQHTHALDQFEQSGAASGQSPVWNGTTWEPQTIASNELPLSYRHSVYMKQQIYWLADYTEGVVTRIQYDTSQDEYTNGRQWKVLLSSSSKKKVYVGFDPHHRFQAVAAAYWIILIKTFNIAENPIFVGFNKYQPYVEPPVGYDVVGFRTVSPNYWQLIMQNASGQRWTETTSQTVNPNTMYKFLIKKTTSGLYEFYLNGTKIGDTALAAQETYPDDAAICEPYCVMDVVGSNVHSFGWSFIKAWY